MSLIHKILILINIELIFFAIKGRIMTTAKILNNQVAVFLNYKNDKEINSKIKEIKGLVAKS